MAEIVLKIKEISKSYRSRSRTVEVLDRISFCAEEGRSYAIVGESGSGKSTLLSILAGLQKPDGGSVLYKEKDIHSLKDAELAVLRRHDIVYVSQFQDVIPELNLAENVRIADCFDDRVAEDAQERTERILARLGLSDLKEELPENLSGGEIRRLTIARALYASPKILLLDEPTNDLDRANRRIVTDALRELSGQGITVLAATHDADLASAADEIIYMDRSLSVILSTGSS